MTYQLNDGLTNVLTGAGTSIDRRMAGHWTTPAYSRDEIFNSYRTSWVMRRAIDLPAKDMTRMGRHWQIKADDIGKIDEAERKIGLWAKLRQALIYGRLGGGAIIMGGPGKTDEEMPKVGLGGLRYMHVLSRWHMTLGPMIRDVESPFYGEPEYFSVSGGSAQSRIHPSRVVAFKGCPIPKIFGENSEFEYWGDPLMTVINDAVINATMAQNGFSSLIDAATIDVVKIKDLMSLLGDKTNEAKLIKRIELVTSSASMHRKMIMDTEEELERLSQTFTGMPEMIMTTLAMVSAATGIPATKFIGKSPDGQNATGNSDDQNYSAFILETQESELRPALDKIDPVMLGSAGIAMVDAWYQFPPLSVMTEAQKADIAEKKARTVTAYVNSGLIPTKALEKSVQTMLVEDGTLPGLDAALEEFNAGTGEGEGDETNPDDDPSQITQPGDE